MVRKEAESARNEVEKRYIANFHPTEAYQSFDAYWRRYAYTEVVEWIEANSKLSIPPIVFSQMFDLRILEGGRQTSNSCRGKPSYRD